MKREEIKGHATDDNGWVIEWECPENSFSEEDGTPHSIEFKIFDGDELLRGNIKWDGCSNWSEPDGDFFHICGLNGLQNLYAAMSMCYQIAGSYMPEANS